jgi:hypothetical protein
LVVLNAHAGLNPASDQYCSARSRGLHVRFTPKVVDRVQAAPAGGRRREAGAPTVQPDGLVSLASAGGPEPLGRSRTPSGCS